MKLKCRELLDVHAKIVSYLETIEADSIEISDDFYWTIPVKDTYDVHTPPTNFTLGQLTEDEVWIRKILNGGEPTGYALVWLASLLKIYGERVGA